METMYLNNKGKETTYNYIMKDIKNNSIIDIISMNYSIYAFNELKRNYRGVKS